MEAIPLSGDEFTDGQITLTVYHHSTLSIAVSRCKCPMTYLQLLSSFPQHEGVRGRF
jgi:hypothetical protein